MTASDDVTKSVIDQDTERPEDGPGVAALVAVASLGAPVSWLIPIAPNVPLIVGREAHANLSKDRAISRQHAEVTFTGAQWTVKDLGSSHGSFVNAKKASEPITLD